MLKCEKCIHKRICIDGANYRNAEACRNFVNEKDVGAVKHGHWNEYAEYLGEMGTDMGKDDFEEVIDLCKHTIGLDHSKPYHRHGKAFYKPYRNYFAASSNGERLLDRLSPLLVVERRETERSVIYRLTPDGLKWLGRQLNITIKEHDENE